MFDDEVKVGWWDVEGAVQYGVAASVFEGVSVLEQGEWVGECFLPVFWGVAVLGGLGCFGWVLGLEEDAGGPAGCDVDMLGIGGVAEGAAVT